MSGFFRQLLIPCLIAFATAAICAVAASPDVQPGVLLLRNGELIEGQITQAGDHYDVTLRDGEIHVRVADVEAVCRDLDDCYSVKRDHVAAGNVNDQLALAEWCLRHKLLDQAGLAIQEGRMIDATHPKLALLERRLKLANEPVHEDVRTASATSDQPSGDELDRTTRGLPPKAVEQFTTNIQPLLLNHCSTAGCHGPQSTMSFHLLRLPSGRTGSRRSTQRNLYAALELVNREHPAESKLLTVPASGHGGAKAAIFGKHQANHYRQLVEWVYLVSSQRIEPSQESNDSASHAPGRLPPGMDQARPLAKQRDAGSPEKLDKPGPLKASAEKASFEKAGTESDAGDKPSDKSRVLPAATWPGSDIELQAPAAAMPLRKPPKRGAVQTEFVPKDEFDPELFNRGAVAPRP
jgi:hypothetical protein